MFKTPDSKWIYILKKFKYDVKFIFMKRNKQFAVFESLDKISFESKINIKIDEKSIAFAPKILGSNEKIYDVKLNNIIAYKIKNARIFTNANIIFLNYKFTLFYEKWHDGNDIKIFDYSTKNIYSHHKNGVRFNFMLSRNILEKAIFLGCSYPDNYYHFLLELISRVEYLDRIPNSKQYPIILDEKISKIPSLATIVNIFLKDYEIQYLSEDLLYRVKQLWYITSPNAMIPNLRKDNKFQPQHTKIRPDSILYLKNKILYYYKNQITIEEKFSKIFIKRKSVIRAYNQDCIEKIVSKYNFTTIYFEDLELGEQINILQNADYIVGATGAAWTNLIFAKNNAKGLIWMGDNWGDVSMFSTIAGIVGFDLNYYIYESKSDNYHEDFNIDTVIFEENLKKLLNI